jgi:hypothetical protein
VIAPLPLLGITYVLALVIGLLFSITTRRQPLRRNIRIATGLLALPALLAVSSLALLRFTVFREPPSLTELRREFPSKRADLERIVRMADQDAKFSRISPDFVDRFSDTPNEYGRYMRNDVKAGLPEIRWDEYRRIFARSRVKLGIQRDGSGDAFIMVDSVGLLNRGHASGYLYCNPAPSAIPFRFYPCNLHQDEGSRAYDPKTRDEAYSFKRIDQHWFAYDEGPS